MYKCGGVGQRDGRESRCCKYRVLMNTQVVNRNILEVISDSNKGRNLISSVDNKLISHYNVSGT